MTEKRFKNRIFAGMLALVLVLCASCGAQGNTSQNNAANSGNSAQSNTSNSAPGGQGSAAVKISDYAARNNNLVFEHEYDSVPMTISGLKDKVVQQKINDAIAAEYERVSDPSFVPQARGVKLYEKQAKSKDGSVYASACANCDNILSVFLRHYRIYNLGNNYNSSASVNTVIPLNFDLSTGEQLSLKDLFPDGMDYMGYLNDRIIQLIQTSDPSKESSPVDWLCFDTQKVPQLISEFKGLREDQPFYLSDKGRLEIVLDFGNPEFYIESGSFNVSLDISDVYWAGKRFGGDRGLFEDNSSRYHLVYFNIPGGIISNRDFSDIPGRDQQHFYVSLQTTQYAGLTEKQNSFLALDFIDLEGRVKEMAGALEEFRATHNNYGEAFVGGYSSASRYGGFVNLSAGYYSYIIAGDRDYGRPQENYLACYRYGTDEEVKLEELFKEGVDWKAVIKKGAIRKAEDFINDETLDPHSKKYSDFLDDMIERITGFSVYSDRLELCFDGNSGAEYFENFEQNGWYYTYPIGDIEFECLGFENLAIFD